MDTTKQMLITDIRVSPDNHKKYNCEPNDSWNFNKCLDVHNDVSLYMESKIGNEYGDLGGQYASFLQSIGIEHQSDNGWWSIAAVTPDNIEIFIEFMSKDENGDCLNMDLCIKYRQAKVKYDILKKAGFKYSKTTDVRKVIETISSLKFE